MNRENVTLATLLMPDYGNAVNIAQKIDVDFATQGTGRNPLHKSGILGMCVLKAGGDYLEIGSQYGRSAVLAAHLTNGQIHCVDPMELLDDPDGDYGLIRKGKRAHMGNEELFWFNMREYGVDDRITLYKEMSKPWPVPEDVKVAVSYVDGDHSFETALWDLKKSAEHTTHYLIADDYLHASGSYKRGVNLAVRAFIRTADDWELVYLDYTQAVLANTKNVDIVDPDNIIQPMRTRYGHYAPEALFRIQK